MSATRWRAALLAALAASLLGLLFGVQSFFALALVPLGYVTFSSLSGAPTPDIEIHRAVSNQQPRPGEDVTVELTVKNSADRPISDLRVREAPPADVPVDGTTRLATALRPGEQTTLTYDVRFPRGEFEFGTPEVRVHNLAGTASRPVDPVLDGTTDLVCQTLLDAVPLQDHTIKYVGRTPTDAGGSGVEFFATREYQRGDPVNRINWRRYARTGELSTVNLREERAMTIVFLIDDRPASQRAQPGYGPDSLDLAVYAASRGLSTLLDDNHRVGVALLSSLLHGGGFVRPGSGPTVEAAASDAFHRTTMNQQSERGTNQISADGGLQNADREATTAVRRLVGHLPPRAQVVCCTPLTDGIGQLLADEMKAREYALTILSPDMAGDATDSAERMCSLQRENRIRRLQRRGIPVVDWSLDTPLALALAAVFDAGGRSL